MVYHGIKWLNDFQWKYVITRVELETPHTGGFYREIIFMLVIFQCHVWMPGGKDGLWCKIAFVETRISRWVWVDRSGLVLKKGWLLCKKQLFNCICIWGFHMIHSRSFCITAQLQLGRISASSLTQFPLGVRSLGWAEIHACLTCTLSQLNRETCLLCVWTYVGSLHQSTSLRYGGFLK